MSFYEELLKSNQEELLNKLELQQQAFNSWQDFLFLNKIDSFEELTLIQEKFLNLLTQRYKGVWKEEILRKVSKEFYKFYEEEDQADGIKIQALDLDGLESGTWEILFEDETEDPIVHVHFKGWEIDYLAITG